MSPRDAYGRQIRKSLPTCYVVDWPDLDMFKVGYTERKRWTRFVFSGANVVALHEFPAQWSGALALEEYLHGYARMLYPLAFPEKTEEAKSTLGSGGGGYLECYRGDGHEFHALMLKHCSPGIARLSGTASSQAMPRTDVTHELTEMQSSPTGDTSPLVTRALAYGGFVGVES